MTGGRLLAIVVVAGGCASARPRIARSSLDTATVMTTSAKPLRGTIGPDADAWFSFYVQLDCSSVTLEVSAKPKHSKLTLVAHGPDGSTRTEHGKDHVELEIGGPVQGHYHVELVGAKAATYRAHLRAWTKGFECGDLPPPPPPRAIASVRVPTMMSMPAAPEGFLLAPIERWDVYETRSHDLRGREGLVGRLTKGYEDGVEPTRSARLVDANGAVLPGITVEIYDGTAVALVSRATVATAIAVLVPLPAHKPAPLQATVTDRWNERGAVFATVATGAFDGVGRGWNGTLESATHATLARVEVVEVHGRSSRVSITNNVSLAVVLDASTATLAPPR